MHVCTQHMIFNPSFVLRYPLPIHVPMLNKHGYTLEMRTKFCMLCLFNVQLVCVCMCVHVLLCVRVHVVSVKIFLFVDFLRLSHVVVLRWTTYILDRQARK